MATVTKASLYYTKTACRFKLLCESMWDVSSENTSYIALHSLSRLPLVPYFFLLHTHVHIQSRLPKSTILVYV